MERNVQFILAAVATVCAFAAVITGARLTSANSLPGMDVAIWKGLHRGTSVAAVAGAAALAIQFTGAMRVWLWGSLVLAALPGGMLEGRTAPQLSGLLHAVASTVMTSVCAVAALQLSRSWRTAAPEPVPDEGSPPLRTLAAATWVGLLVQTGFGALYRHQILGLLPHVAGAMIVMGMVMYAGIAALSTENAPGAVKRPALTLLILTGVQMLFGLAAYLYRIEFREQATGLSAMLTFTMIHVAVGALTTACAALMGMQILRYVRPAEVAR